LYAGTFDTACGALSTEMILHALDKWDSPDDNKAWETMDRDIWAQPHDNTKGFIKQYKNLTQIIIPGSGHQVPYYKPEISRDMIYKWIADEKFPKYKPELKQSEK
jgi:vitellogenic carboxypeptidase-like protein